MQHQFIQIAVVGTGPGQLLGKTDVDVPGLYEVAIPIGQSADLDLADVALESFHNSVAISSLEDFDIQVFNPATGDQLTPGFGSVEKLFECKKIAYDIQQEPGR